MSNRLSCPFCGNSHPRWLLDGMLPESGSVICGATSCGGEMQAASDDQGWSRWNTRASERMSTLEAEAQMCGHLEDGYRGKPGMYPDWVFHASKDREHREKSIPWLNDLLAALEWQGGTIHDALNAVWRIVQDAKNRNRVPDGARMARCSLCRQEFPDDHLANGVCATCRPKAGWVQS